MKPQVGREGELAALFARETARLLGEAAAGLDALAAGGGVQLGEIDELRFAAHRIAGSAAVLAYEPIVEVARALERELALLPATGEVVDAATQERLREGFQAIEQACPIVKPIGTADGVAAMTVVEAQHGRPLVIQIEDDPVNARLVERILERRPHVKLSTYALGRAGIEAVLTELPALLLLDLHLPDMRGEEVLRRLRADDRARGVRIVLASASVLPDRQRTLLEEGADVVLGKPFDVRALLALVDETC